MWTSAAHDKKIYMGNISLNIRAITLVCLSFLLIGGVCEMVPTSDPIDLKEIPGIYEANYNAGLVDRLELRADSVYIRYFVLKEGRKFVDSGICSYYYRGGDSTDVDIAFFNFINRFTVDPNHVDIYSTAKNAVYDSTPHLMATVFFKSHGLLRIYRETHGQAYIKKQK